MEDEVILKVENLFKQYRLGNVGTGTISHDLNRFFAKIRGKEDPYLKIGESNDRSKKAKSEYVWALKDINFEVKRGEILGIIGKNGAGKSTLLKILSKVTSPTQGSIKSKGRIASLLEVGTGFHPEMTGKENIFLNGANLGMTKKEIASKLDEIIQFSGCDRYIDTPVKRYSSGMKVRLAFAVAAHLEPDILVVDEVLAVGDAEFQKKAIGKMQDISKTEGRTVLFVSHDMSAINALCSRLILVENGKINFNGDVDKGIHYYLKDENNLNLNLKSKDGITLEKIEIIDSHKNVKRIIEVFSPVAFVFECRFENEIPVSVKIRFIILNNQNEIMSSVSSSLNSLNISPKESFFKLQVDLVSGFSLKEGDYTIDIEVVTYKKISFHNVLGFSLLNSKYTGYKLPLKKQHGIVYTPNRWNIY